MVAPSLGPRILNAITVGVFHMGFPEATSLSGWPRKLKTALRSPAWGVSHLGREHDRDGPRRSDGPDVGQRERPVLEMLPVSP